MNIAQAHSTLRILMVGAEMAPWAKVGGLGDVLGALPSALEKEGAQVVVCLPFYSRLKEHIKDSKPLHRRPFWMHWGGMQSFQYWLRQARHPGGFELLLVDCPALYDRPGIYHSPGSHEEYSDNLLRWTTLCHAALTGSYLLGGEWDVVHAHDMHAALTLPLMRERHSMSPLANAVGVLSIHNLAYQGNYPLSALKQIGLQSADVRPFGPYEFYGRFNCLKAGIEFADGIHTVSPTYANEIISNEEIGFGLRGVLWG
ncbi:MAG: glycogen/starch synthase, partial [Chitinophagaceae bacterium]|nr:glycogen/starch synthase [Chitinophagaceae bacterium]